MKGNALIAQGGGPTAVINESLVGAVLEMKKQKNIETIYGAVHGVNGILKENLINLSDVSNEHLEEISKNTCSALLSTRDKPDKEYCLKILEVFKKLNIRYFFYIGGNDSSDTVRILSEFAVESGYEFKAFHIPKTIDNDLPVNDHTPGFGSAAKFIGEAFIGANLETRALGGVYIGVIMGRHAGFLTAASSVGRTSESDGPHLIYVPEIPVTPEKIVSDVKEVFEKYGRCVVAVSEGIVNEDHTPIVATLKENVTRDSHGNIELAGGELGDMLSSLLKEKLNISRVRADTFGYLQRSYFGTRSDSDAKEARLVGVEAVKYAMKDEHLNGSIYIKRESNSPYTVSYGITELKNVAAQTRYLEEKFINSKGNNVTDEFIEYIKPLVGSNFNYPVFFKEIKD